MTVNLRDEAAMTKHGHLATNPSRSNGWRVALWIVLVLGLAVGIISGVMSDNIAFGEMSTSTAAGALRFSMSITRTIYSAAGFIVSCVALVGLSMDSR